MTSSPGPASQVYGRESPALACRPDRLWRTLRRRWPVVLCGLWLATVAGCSALHAARQHPRLEIEAPPALAAQAHKLREYPAWQFDGVMRLVGLRQAGAPIRVVLLPESSPQAQATPSWISGYAYGELGAVFLMPERAPAYPDGSLLELLRHEVAHILIHRAAGGQPVPRWFNEGLAMAAAGGWGSGDHTRLAFALLLEARTPLATLDQRFAGGSGTVARAYAVSGALVRDLLQTYGAWVPAQILRGLRMGLPFSSAFRRATGVSLAAAEADFWSRYSLWYRWVPILTSSFTLWILIMLLALFAFRRRRQRDAALAAAWEEENPESPGPPEEDDHDSEPGPWIH